MGKKLFIIHPWDFELNSARIKSKKGKSFVKQKEEKSHWWCKCLESLMRKWIWEMNFSQNVREIMTTRVMLERKTEKGH